MTLQLTNLMQPLVVDKQPSSSSSTTTMLALATAATAGVSAGMSYDVTRSEPKSS